MDNTKKERQEAAGRFSIELTGLHFYAKHGVYAEEQVLGAEFEVNLAVDCAAPDSGAVGLDQTINYVRVYEIIKEAFERPTALLENCALQISSRLQETFTHMVRIDLSIRKLSPPITGFGGSVWVRYVKNLTSSPFPAEL